MTNRRLKFNLIDHKSFNALVASCIYLIKPQTQHGIQRQLWSSLEYMSQVNSLIVDQPICTYMYPTCIYLHYVSLDSFYTIRHIHIHLQYVKNRSLNGSIALMQGKDP